MSVNSKIITALTPFVKSKEEVCLDRYRKTETTYIVFNYADDRAKEYADNEPQTELKSMQIHLFCPEATEPSVLIKKIRTTLFRAGFTYPVIPVRTIEEDTKTRHIVFECSITEQTELESEE